MELMRVGYADADDLTRRCIDAVAMEIATAGCGYRNARATVRARSIADPAVWERVDAHFKALPADAWVAA